MKNRGDGGIGNRKENICAPDGLDGTSWIEARGSGPGYSFKSGSEKAERQRRRCLCVYKQGGHLPSWHATLTILRDMVRQRSIAVSTSLR